jgi:hypothetical protein
VAAPDTTSSDDAPDGTSGGGTSGGDEPPTDLSGVWVRATDWSTCVRVIGRFDESRIYTLTRVEVTQRGYRVSERHEICQVRSTPVAGLETLIPKAAVDAGNPILVESALFGQGVGATYAGGLQVQLWGMRMNDPLTDALPTREGLPDPRIYDADGDGFPGVTFTVGGDFCFMRAVQRTLSSIYGTLQPDGRILGQSAVVSEQVVLEATSSFCDTSWEVRANDTFNNIVMVRADDPALGLDADGDGTVTCEEIIAGQDRVIVWSEVSRDRCRR